MDPVDPMSRHLPDVDEEIDDVEDLSGFDADFLSSLEGLGPRARRTWIALERESLERLASLRHRPMSAELQAAVEAEAFTGERLTRLRLTRQMRDLAVAQCDAAVLAAREVGYSWAELARILGVSRQALQQRFRARAEDQAAGHAEDGPPVSE